MKRLAPRSATAAMRRASNRQWVLKPQDFAVAFKLVALRGAPLSYAALARQLQLSPFEAHAAVQRLVAAKLAFDREGAVAPNLAALRAFAVNGAAHAYPPVEGEITIGFPTAHGVDPMKSRAQQGSDLPPVWPHPEGTTKGTTLLPLYEKLPLAAREDSGFYELLALFDSLRIGQAREREIARGLLEERLLAFAT